MYREDISSEKILETYKDLRSVEKTSKALRCSRFVVTERLKEYGGASEIKARLPPKHQDTSGPEYYYENGKRKLPPRLRPAFKDFLLDVIEAKTERGGPRKKRR